MLSYDHRGYPIIDDRHAKYGWLKTGVGWILTILSAQIASLAFWILPRGVQRFKHDHESFTINGRIHVRVLELLSSYQPRLSCRIAVRDLLDLCLTDHLERPFGDISGRIVVIGGIGVVDGYDVITAAARRNPSLDLEVVFFEPRNCAGFIDDDWHPRHANRVHPWSFIARVMMREDRPAKSCSQQIEPYAKVTQMPGPYPKTQAIELTR